MNLKNDMITLSSLVKRSLKVFLKDRMTVFFSLLAPIIILVLYILFLGDIQVTSIKSQFDSFGVSVDDKLIGAFVDSWMLSGVMAVSCITVSFSVNTVMVHDRENGIINDMISSPIRKYLINFSYIVANFVITSVICFAILVIAFVYIAISGWYISVGEVFGIIGTTLLSILCASLFSVFITKFFKTEAALGGFIGILSAAIGFLCGAYMPISMFPKAIQYFVLIIPGTYSAGIFKTLFMSGALDELVNEVGYEQLKDGLIKDFSIELDFFGKDIGAGVMLGILSAFTAVFLIVTVVSAFMKKKTTHFPVKTGKTRKL